jgi:hypothetical protein
MNDMFIRAQSNREAATLVIYTEGKTPEQAVEEIIQKLH